MALATFLASATALLNGSASGYCIDKASCTNGGVPCTTACQLAGWFQGPVCDTASAAIVACGSPPESVMAEQRRQRLLSAGVVVFFVMMLVVVVVLVVVTVLRFRSRKQETVRGSRRTHSQETLTGDACRKQETLTGEPQDPLTGGAGGGDSAGVLAAASKRRSGRAAGPTHKVRVPVRRLPTGDAPDACSIAATEREQYEQKLKSRDFSVEERFLEWLTKRPRDGRKIQDWLGSGDALCIGLNKWCGPVIEESKINVTGKQFRELRMLHKQMNIMHFHRALRKLGVPENFHFDEIDVTEGKRPEKFFNAIWALGQVIAEGTDFKDLRRQLREDCVTLPGKQKVA